MDRIKNEPVLTVALVEAIVALVVAFGVDLSGEQIGAIMAVTSAALGWVARQRVTPVE